MRWSGFMAIRFRPVKMVSLVWVPGIEEKLEAAKTFGEDVHVPLADWVTYVDPQLASELKPDLRAWPGGITKNEARLRTFAAPAIGANKRNCAHKRSHA